MVREPSTYGYRCVTAASLGVAAMYDDGILCSRPLRSLKVYTRDLVGQPALTVSLYKDGAWLSEQVLPHFVMGGGVAPYEWFTRKQGYALPVLPSTTHELRLSLPGGAALDADSIVEFSDPVLGNRWGRDELWLR